MAFQSGVLYSQCVTSEPKIKSILYNIGIPPLVRGYPYIIDAALMIAEGDNDANMSYNDVYFRIASRYFTTPELVERAIKHAIQISWEWEGNRSLKNYYSEEQTMPTNREFFDFLNANVGYAVNAT